MLGDFNAEDTGPSLFQFLEQYAAKSIMKESTYFKNPNRSTCNNPSKHSSWWRRLSSSSSENVFKTSSRRLDQDQYIRLGHTSSRRLQNVFKTSSRRLAKTSSRHLQDVFKTYHQVKLFLLTRLWEAFNTFLRCSFPKTIIYRGICLGNTTSHKFMVSV